MRMAATIKAQPCSTHRFNGEWFLQPCHSPEQPVHVLPSSLCYKGNNAYVIKLCYYENKTN